ncbi:MAG: AAA family ATPase [Chitinivibrionales bacterium]|nr:AAA family ATPase [Chitinivibrionales bacterium]
MAQAGFPHSWSAVLAALRARLAAPAPGRIQVLVGPRQVGKTTLLLRLEHELGEHCIYVAADSPEASLPGWWEQVWRGAEDAAQGKGSAVLLVDEIHYLAHWSRLLKARYDRIARKRIPLHVVVSGSSALQLGSGGRESLAGRFERLELRHWSASELAAQLKLKPVKAVQQSITYGTYPGAQQLLSHTQRWRAYVRDSIIDPAIGRDLLMTETIRKPALLRQVFAVCIGHPAEIVSLQKLCGQLAEKGALQTVAHYLELLEKAGLVAALRKYSPRALRLRASPPKLVALNQAMLSVMESVDIPLREKEPARFGRWVENACIACAHNAGHDVYYWRAEPLEVDLVMQGAWGKWAVEIKTGPYTSRDLAGLLEFSKNNPAFAPLVLCDPEHTRIAENAGVRALAWEKFLLEGAG